MPLAYLTVRTDLPFRRFWTVLVALPLVIPSYIGAFTFVSAFGPRGEFQDVLAPYGIDQLPEIYGLGGTILVITLYTYPYVFLTTRASLLSLDIRLIDAARTLNHGRWGAFRRVTLPHIRPAILAGGLLAALYAISDFGTPAIMQLPVFTRQIFVENNAFNQEYAALLSLQLLAVVVVVLAVERRLRSDRTVEGDGSASTVDSRISLGPARWLAVVLPVTVAGVALLVPIWILGLWLLRTGTVGHGSAAFKPAYVVNSVSVSVAAAVAAVVIALPVAYLSAREDTWLASAIERTTYLGFAVPGVVLGLALIYFSTRTVPSLYQTIPLLVFAYVIRFVPQAVGTIRTATLTVDQRLVEAARTLGADSFGAFRRITFPLVVPGVIAGGALVFLTTMKELPVTLFLRPIGFKTVVLHIWQAQEAATYQYAVVPTVLLLLVSGLSMVILLRQGDYDV